MGIQNTTDKSSDFIHSVLSGLLYVTYFFFPLIFRWYANSPTWGYNPGYQHSEPQWEESLGSPLWYIYIDCHLVIPVVTNVPDSTFLCHWCPSWWFLWFNFSRDDTSYLSLVCRRDGSLERRWGPSVLTHPLVYSPPVTRRIVWDYSCLPVHVPF